MNNPGQSERMDFAEAMVRARAAHVVVKSFRQPGNHNQLQYQCKCGSRPFAADWAQHRLDAADKLRESEAS